MTSFIINAHTHRPIPEFWRNDKGCAFCQIIERAAPAYRLYEDDKVVAFLDILPIRPGHMLIVPKVHYARVSDLPPEYAAALGQAISRLSLALTKAMQNTALNVVCNQEYAQAVAHVHYHVVPAPDLGGSRQAEEITRKAPLATDIHNRELEAREELDDGDAIQLVGRIKTHL
ncbi:HIT-like protein [Auriscalpium vulgare]|uniref:HIT-like protein n=1 Tax=Auriscalpium vulgare TaxID=40419 RepID=A0ACB8S4V7_9AGAM|nr:HIT-like protein [Auriscalpium vulgare]